MKKFFSSCVLCFALCLFSACGGAKMPELESKDFSDMLGGADDGDESGTADTGESGGFGGVDSGNVGFGGDAANDKTASPAETDAMKELFGENCIASQTFEVELSEYIGKVYFVPFVPSGNEQDPSIQIIQGGQVLADLPAYVPKELKDKSFTSLDAVSFFDVNYDGYTDICLIETYGDKSFAVVYYGFATDAESYERYFFVEDELSDNITAQVDALTISSIRDLLSDGKKNGEFTSYQEAYRAVSRLSDLEWSGSAEYDLIYFNEDDIPELAAGVEGYNVSLYTYRDGKIYMLMDAWAYGAMGNAGYEYCPGKNSMRNYNSDYAGAIMYTTFMAIREGKMDVVVQIVTYNFDDSNGNGIPDEGEEESLGMYGVNYIDGEQVAYDVFDSYEAGEYVFLVPSMSFEEFTAALDNSHGQ